MNIATDHHTDQQAAAAHPLMRAQRIFAMRDAVLNAWEHQVRASVRGADRLLTPILINTLPAFFDNLAAALTPGHPRDNAASNSNVPAMHGNERARMTTYGPEQLIEEYQIFRDCFAAIAQESGIALRGKEWHTINVSIDTGIRESIRAFTSTHDGFRRRIAAGLSHDMRNPLAVMCTSAQLLLQPAEPERVAQLAQQIAAHGKRLDSMIEELLDSLSYHRGQQLPLVLSHFDVLPLAHAVASQLNLQQPGKCVVSGHAVSGWWCENSLRRALENLLGNALKYGNHEPISVHVEETHERLLITVHNGGRAIAPDQMQRIFDYLRRENHGSAPGWGIGLPFVQNVAESHGGSVAVDSAPETGTSFIFDVPVDCRPFVVPTGMPGN
ncbi:sensor histidine kinase [Janthinobacterium sp. HLX7-2]|uniref:sensor histidine kinase n=1 Tax=Janthinobacterium sp. HLX7-2 TaxID=1259331 RepID=UPI003F277250